MSALLWPAVALVGLVLAFIVAMRFVTRREAVFASKHDLSDVARSATRNCERVEAMALRIEDRTKAIEEELAKTQARIPAQPGDRAMPFGLRRGPVPP